MRSLPPRLRLLRRRHARRQRAMTLIEIMVVVVIMSLIASAVGIAVFNSAKKARIEDATQGVRTIENAAQIWQQDHPNACPTVERLVADGILNRRQRTRDPWDNEYAINCDNGDVTVRSRGPDGREGTDDDIPPRNNSNR